MALSTQGGGGSFSFPEIRSVPNLRLICLRRKIDGKTTDEPLAGIYRSSKPDRITAEDIVEFRKLGIKNIIDFRSLGEYRGTDGLCTLDKEYSIYKVCMPSKKSSITDSVKFELILKSNNEKVGPEDGTTGGEVCSEKRHFFINFFNTTYIVTLMRRLPWRLFLCGMLHLVYDLFMRNKFKSFTHFFIKNVVNTGGIIGQYIDIVDLSGPSIRAGLKLATNLENMPVLINCAHGKDRTGIMTALILTCLGMSPEYIVQEYALSQEGLKSVRHIMHDDICGKLQMREEFINARARTMISLLDYINKKYGSVEDYMVSIGFTMADQKALRENLVVFESQQVRDMVARRGGGGEGSEEEGGGDGEVDGLNEKDVLISDKSHFD